MLAASCASSALACSAAAAAFCASMSTTCFNRCVSCSCVCSQGKSEKTLTDEEEDADQTYSLTADFFSCGTNRLSTWGAQLLSDEVLW